ncbi:MAG: DUF1097 domain-containing protein [Planctomycetota bacterium]|jgi:hypothetical protein
MPFHKFILIPIFIAFQAFVMMLVAPYIPFAEPAVGGPGLLAWVAFQAWAMYFLAGGTPKMGLKTLIGYFGGIVASIAIFELAGLLSGLPGHLGLCLAVFIVVVPVISAQRVPWIDFVPSYFLGAGVFFGIMGFSKLPAEASGYFTAALPEMVACAMGLVWGFVTITYQTWFTAKFGGGEGEAAE